LGEAVAELQQMLQALKRPEYVHVLLNPLSIYGMVMAQLALVLGLLTGNKGAQMVALVLMALVCLSVWPVTEFGDKGAEHIGAKTDSNGMRWMKLHEDRAHAGVWAYYATGVIALVALLAKWKLPKLERWLMALVLVAALVSLGFGGWIAHAGGEIRHIELCAGPPPSKADSQQ
jgi:hypothetical protein